MEAILLNELKKVMWRLIEAIAILAIGFSVTVFILKPIYENFGIQFMGNVWVNWFGMSYILFTLYTLVVGLFIMKESKLFKQRLTSTVLWILFVGSNYVVFIPFAKGEIPF